jgi:hypothetical protein
MGAISRARTTGVVRVGATLGSALRRPHEVVVRRAIGSAHAEAHDRR